MVKKWGREKFYISCSYPCTISFLVKIFFPFFSGCLNLMKKLNSNQNVKVEKMGFKTLVNYHRKFNFHDFFRGHVKP